MLFPCLGDFDMLLYGKFANLGGGLIMTVCCHVHEDCDITIVMNNVLRENMMEQTPYLDEYLETMSVIHNTQRPESTLKKKLVAICYHHFMRESIAMGESLTAHIRSEYNPADICTEVIAGGAKRDRLTDQILYFASNFSIAVTKSIKKCKDGQKE